MKNLSSSSSTNDFRGQHDTSYYQPQPPANYNQRHQYLNHRTTQRAPYTNYYYKEKVDKCGVTKGGIPSSDIKQLPIIPLISLHNFINKTPTFY